MLDMSFTYRVTGRYMDGSNVIAYHLVGTDGSQVTANKERIIYMIGKGQVENMRLQVNGEDIILRGKGVNLNELPVYDIKKGNFRDNQASQNAASTNVSPKKGSNINPMGQLEIVKRIMYKTNCVGYVVTDHSGIERNLTRDRVVALAGQRLISNAIVQNYTPKDSGKAQIILRGVGCDLGALPVVSVDKNGNIVENADKKVETVHMRAVRMRRGGVIYDQIKSTRYPFEPGDFIVCGNSASLRAIKASDAEHIMTSANGEATAVCDEYLSNLSKYPVELFGGSAQSLSAEQVMKWPIVEIVRSR